MEENAGTTETPRERKRLPRALLHLIAWVVVLGILAALLIPAYMRECESARRTGCLSNVSDLGIALQNYA